MGVALVAALASLGVLSPPDAETLEDVLAAAFRNQIADIFATQGARFAREPVICVGVEEDGEPRDPGASLLKRLAVDPSVRPASRCEVGAEAVRESETGREAVILRSGEVEWVEADEAHVAMSYYRSVRSQASMTIRVVKERHGWTGLGPTWKQSVQGAHGR